MQLALLIVDEQAAAGAALIGMPRGCAKDAPNRGVSRIRFRPSSQRIIHNRVNRIKNGKPFLVGNKVPLGDGVDKNDKKFLSEFPYLAAPDSGFDSNPSQRFEPAHPPTPPGGP